MGRRGPRGQNDTIELLRTALRVLDDPVALQDSPLAHLPVVRSAAARTFGRRICPEGQALAALLLAALRSVADGLGDHHPVGRLARMTAEGKTQAEVAHSLNVRPEHLSRHFKPLLLRCLLQELHRLDRESVPRETAENSVQ